MLILSILPKINNNKCKHYKNINKMVALFTTLLILNMILKIKH